MTERKEIDDDLQWLISAWPKLLKKIRAEIVELVKSKGIEFAVDDTFEKRDRTQG